MSALSIDSYRCNGCGTCCAMCPDVFILNPLTGKADLIDPAQGLAESIRQAAAFCPEKCILISEDKE